MGLNDQYNTSVALKMSLSLHSFSAYIETSLQHGVVVSVLVGLSLSLTALSNRYHIASAPAILSGLNDGNQLEFTRGRRWNMYRDHGRLLTVPR